MLSFLVNLLLLSGLVLAMFHMIAVESRLKALQARIKTPRARLSNKGFAELVDDMTDTVRSLKQEADLMTHTLRQTIVEARAILEEIDWSFTDAEIARKLAVRIPQEKMSVSPDVLDDDSGGAVAKMIDLSQHTRPARFAGVMREGATIIPFCLAGTASEPVPDDGFEEELVALGLLSPDEQGATKAAMSFLMFTDTMTGDERG